MELQRMTSPFLVVCDKSLFSNLCNDSNSSLPVEQTRNSLRLPVVSDQAHFIRESAANVPIPIRNVEAVPTQHYASDKRGTSRSAALSENEGRAEYCRGHMGS